MTGPLIQNMPRVQVHPRVLVCHSTTFNHRIARCVAANHTKRGSMWCCSRSRGYCNIRGYCQQNPRTLHLPWIWRPAFTKMEHSHPKMATLAELDGTGALGVAGKAGIIGITGIEGIEGIGRITGIPNPYLSAKGAIGGNYSRLFHLQSAEAAANEHLLLCGGKFRFCFHVSLRFSRRRKHMARKTNSKHHIFYKN